MTGDGKLLKISCLTALFVGLGTLVLGVVLALGNLADLDAWATAAEGLGSAVFGVRSAILANVPSNTSKIRGKSVALMLLAAVTLGYLVYSGAAVQVAQLCLAAVVAIVAVVAFVLASKIVRDQLRR